MFGMECWLFSAYSVPFISDFQSIVLCACTFTCIHYSNSSPPNTALYVCLCFCHLLKVNICQTTQSFFLICTTYYIHVPYIKSKPVSKEPHTHDRHEGSRIIQGFLYTVLGAELCFCLCFYFT